MHETRWGMAGPPEEAYGRVTDAARFAPLHDAARALIARLDAQYDVTCMEGAEPPGEPHPGASGVRLTPASEHAAPLFLSFTTFPGLIVHAGCWYREPVPGCGCDACDESLDSALHRLAWLVDCVTAGRFQEWITLPPLLGGAWVVAELGTPGMPESGGFRQRISRAEARARLSGGRSRYDWQPWPLR